jgi:hypothetical protein
MLNTNKFNAKHSVTKIKPGKKISFMSHLADDMN